MRQDIRKTIISKVNRVIIKIGSSILTDKNGSLSESIFEACTGNLKNKS